MKAKILIIDDTKTIRFQVRKILESEEENQFEILEAEDGVSALENLVRLEKDSLPDLILLDRNMPRMNGDEFIRIFNIFTGIFKNSIHDAICWAMNSSF